MAVVSKSNFLKNKDGFTLTELILVIVILGILAGLVFPEAANIIRKQRLQSAAKEMVSDIRMAQQLAISKEIEVQLVFRNYESSLPNSYSIKLGPNYATNIYKTAELPEDISIIISKTILIKMDGSCQNDTVTLQNKNNETLFVVFYMNGRFRITGTEP